MEEYKTKENRLVGLEYRGGFPGFFGA